MSKANPTWSSWATYYLIIVLFLAALTIWSGLRFEQYVFNRISAESVVDLLIPLLLIALFVERALEVFVTTWMGIDRAKLEAALANAGALENDAKAKNDSATQERALTNRLAASDELEEYKATTKRIAFLTALSFGVLISMAGVRVLYPLLNWDIEYTGAQKLVFNFVDIFLTGGLIGGGSDGIHKVLSVFLDFMDKTRALIQRSEKNLRDNT